MALLFNGIAQENRPQQVGAKVGGGIGWGIGWVEDAPAQLASMGAKKNPAVIGQGQE